MLVTWVGCSINLVGQRGNGPDWCRKIHALLRCLFCCLAGFRTKVTQISMRKWFMIGMGMGTVPCIHGTDSSWGLIHVAVVSRTDGVGGSIQNSASFICALLRQIITGLAVDTTHHILLWQLNSPFTGCVTAVSSLSVHLLAGLSVDAPTERLFPCLEITFLLIGYFCGDCSPSSHRYLPRKPFLLCAARCITGFYHQPMFHTPLLLPLLNPGTPPLLSSGRLAWLFSSSARAAAWQQ